MPPQAAKTSIPEENLVSNNAKESIKRLSNVESKFRKKVVVTKCLSDPCPGFYTDTLSESILIECRDPMHDSCDDGGK